MTRPQWWLNATNLDVFALCEHLAARGSNANPGHVDDFTAPSGTEDLKRLIAIAEADRYVRTDPGFQDLAHAHDPVVITPTGLRHIETVHEHRNRRDERLWAARQGLLRWAYEHAIEDPNLPMNSPARFLAADPAYNFWGEPFTENNVREATEYLLGQGLLELYGARLASGEPQNIQITQAGKDCIEQYDGRIISYVKRRDTAPAPSNNQYFLGAFRGQNAQGQNITQTHNAGANAEDLAAIFDGLRDLLAQVQDADDRETLTITLEDLELSARQPTPNVEDITRRAGMLNRLATNAGGAAFGAAVGTATSGLIDLLAAAVT